MENYVLCNNWHVTQMGNANGAHLLHMEDPWHWLKNNRQRSACLVLRFENGFLFLKTEKK